MVISDKRKSVSVVSYEDSQLIFQFLTPEGSSMLDTRIVVPCYELPIYRTTGYSDMSACNKPPHANGDCLSWGSP